MFWFVLICDLLVPLAMVGGGYFMWRHTPDEPDSLVGYRTIRSMQNRDTWRFANTYAGRLWFWVGLVTLIPSAAVHIPFAGSTEDTLGYLTLAVVFVQLLVMCFTIPIVEAAICRTFDDNGARK